VTPQCKQNTGELCSSVSWGRTFNPQCVYLGNSLFYKFLVLPVFNSWPVHVVLFVPLLDLKFALFDNKPSLCTDVFTWLWHTGIKIMPMHFKIAVFWKLFLSMMHVHLMEIELGQWAKSCRLVLISKSDHCQKTFELTLTYTGCPGRNVPDFGRLFLKLKYTDITKNTYILSWMVMEIKAREKWSSCGSMYCTWFAWRLPVQCACPSFSLQPFTLRLHM